MSHLIPVLTSTVLLAVAVPAVAQDAVDRTAPDPATLEALCEANASNAADKGLCLYVIHQLMLPGSDSESKTYGLGDPQDRDGMTVTPLKVDWNAKPARTYSTPGKRMKFVSVLVKYTAGDDRDSYLMTSWGVSDRGSLSYEQPLHGAEPDLGYGQIRPGETVRGWVTFEVPRKASWLELRYEQPLRDPLRWTISDKKRK